MRDLASRNIKEKKNNSKSLSKSIAATYQCGMIFILTRYHHSLKLHEYIAACTTERRARRMRVSIAKELGIDIVSQDLDEVLPILYEPINSNLYRPTRDLK